MARLLRGLLENALDRRVSRAAGELCGTTATTDVVDAHVALLVRDEDLVLTSNVDEIRRLRRARGVNAQVRRC